MKLQLNSSVLLSLELSRETHDELVLAVSPALDMFINTDELLMSFTVLLSVTLNCREITLVVPSDGESDPVLTQAIVGAVFPIDSVAENVSEDPAEVSIRSGAVINIIVARKIIIVSVFVFIIHTKNLI